MNESEPIIKTYIGKRGKMKGREFKIILDEEGELLYNKYAWYVNNQGKNQHYLVRSDYKNGKVKIIKFHREFIAPQKDQAIDHINRNSLDNRKGNLRIVTQSQNCMNTKMKKNNTSGHRGVCWDKTHKVWLTQILWKGKRIVKYSHDYNLACEAYKKLANELFGEYLGEVANA